MIESERREYRQALAELQRKHRDLDYLILELEGCGDQLALQRLKKQKLALKDQITVLESDLIPDLDA